MPEPKYLTPSEAGDYLGVHEQTVKRWARAGKIAALRTPGGWWRFRREDLDAAMTAPEPETAA